MKRTSLLVPIAMVLMLVAIVSVSAAVQEFITEEEAAEWFEQDPESLVAGLEANTTVVLPTPGEHECRFAILCKKVFNENGEKLSGALVIVEAHHEGTWVKWLKPGEDWNTDGTAEGWTAKCGIVCFLLLWDSDPPETIEVTITVSKEGYQTKIDTVDILGATWCYWYNLFNCFCNRLTSGVPEFSLTTPLVMSVGTATYLLMQRRRKKKE